VSAPQVSAPWQFCFYLARSGSDCNSEIARRFNATSRFFWAIHFGNRLDRNLMGRPSNIDEGCRLPRRRRLAGVGSTATGWTPHQILTRGVGSQGRRLPGASAAAEVSARLRFDGPESLRHRLGPQRQQRAFPVLVAEESFAQVPIALLGGAGRRGLAGAPHQNPINISATGRRQTMGWQLSPHMQICLPAHVGGYIRGRI
jgi:hypothetical protein